MAETTLKFTVDANGAITNIEKLGGSLAKFEGTSTQAQRGLAGLAGGLNNLKAGFDLVSGALGGVISATAELVNLGTASRQAKEGLDALSGGRAVQYLEMMRASTRGLVPDTELLHSATKAMALGLAQTGDQLALLAKGGTILGRVMGIDAAQGVETLTVAMSRVGQTMLLDNIGLSATNVMKRFNELKKTMSDQDAWSAAVLEEVGKKTKVLEGNLDGAGSGVKRLENAFDSLKTSAGENLSYLIDQTLILMGALDEYYARQGKGNTSPPGTVPGLAGGQMNDAAWYAQTAKQMNDLMKAQEDALKYKFLYLDGAKMTGALLQGAFGQGSLFRGDTWSATAAPDYDKQYRDFILQQQTAREVAKREANKRYQNFAFLGGQFGGMGGDFLGASFTAAGQSYNRAAQLPDAMKTLNQIIAGGQSLLAPYAKGIENIAAAYDKATDAAKRGQSISAAFGTGNGGLFGEIGGGMNSAFNDRRAQVEADLARRYGKGSKKYTAGLDAFDKDQKVAMDAYQIATGQATKASIYFNDQLTALQKQYSSGKISAQDYAKELYNIGIAAQNSGGDLDTLMQLMGRSAEGTSTTPKPKPFNAKDAIGNWGNIGKSKEHKPGIASGTEREEVDITKNSPFAALQKGLGEIDNGIKGITDKTTAIPGVMASNFKTAADNVQPLTKAVDAVQAKLNATLAQNAHIRITYEVIGGDSSAPPTRGRAF